jgi:hypothetical protein
MGYIIEYRERWEEHGEIIATADTTQDLKEVLKILPKAPIGYYYKVLRNTSNYKL